MERASYRADEYGEVWADFLDTWTEMTGSVPSAALIDRVVELSGNDGRVLELGVGTGYIALPLAARGVRVEGLDGSSQMLERLAAKPGGADVPTHLGDFAKFHVPGQFDLIFFGSSSLFCLPDQEAQVRCFASVARHLAVGGAFLVATYVPDNRWFTDGKMHFIQASGPGWRMHWNARNDPVEQVTAVERVLEWDDGRRDHFPHREKYCSPAEMDLMARLAGMRLRERWGTWDKGAYTGEGEAISLYVRASPLDTPST